MSRQVINTVLIALAFVGCRAPEPTMQRTELFFGLNRPDGGRQISDDEWRAFVNDVVTPRFPGGLTILEARGQWRGASGAIESEPSRILILLHQTTPDDDRKIEEIRRAYREKFQQEAVMRVDDIERVSF